MAATLNKKLDLATSPASRAAPGCLNSTVPCLSIAAKFSLKYLHACMMLHGVAYARFSADIHFRHLDRCMMARLHRGDSQQICVCVCVPRI